MNRWAARLRFLVALGHAFHVPWPVLSAILGIQLALGLLTGFVEGWSLGDTVYFTFITGLTVGYGDFVPRQTLTRVTLGAVFMSYGADIPDLFRRTASYIDKILKGANPSDLPIEQPTKFKIDRQSKNRQSAQPHHSAFDARPGRQSD